MNKGNTPAEKIKQLNSNTRNSRRCDCKVAAKAIKPLAKRRVKSSQDSVSTMEALRLEIINAVAEFQTLLTRIVVEEKLDLAKSINIQSDKNGNLVIVEGGAERDKLQTLLNDEPRLASVFHRAEHCSHIVKNAEETVSFQKAYAHNAGAAVTEYTHLLNKGTKTFTMSVGRIGKGVTADLVVSTKL